MNPRLSPAFFERPIAHRALHNVFQGRPENSRSAILAAIEKGFGIEIDVQPSADGVPMVFHDYDLNRLTGEAGAIRLRSADDLRSMPLTGGAEGIPDLAEVLQLVRGQVPLLIEIKDQDGEMGPDTGGLEQQVADALDGYAGPVGVMSFNPHSVAALAGLVPGLARGLVTSSYDPTDWPLSQDTCNRLRDIPDFDRVGASFISHEVSDLSRPRVAELKAAGADILCWTVRSEPQAKEALEVAQNITFEGYLPAAAS